MTNWINASGMFIALSNLAFAPSILKRSSTFLFGALTETVGIVLNLQRDRELLCYGNPTAVAKKECLDDIDANGGGQRLLAA